LYQDHICAKITHMSHSNPISVAVKELNHSVRMFRRLVTKDGRIAEYKRRQEYVVPAQQRKKAKIERLNKIRRYNKERAK